MMDAILKSAQTNEGFSRVQFSDILAVLPHAILALVALAILFAALNRILGIRSAEDIFETEETEEDDCDE